MNGASSRGFTRFRSPTDLPVQNDRRARPGIDGEPEDVGPVIVADRVEQPACGVHRRQVDLGGQDPLLRVAAGPATSSPFGGRDQAVARFDPPSSWSNAWATRSRFGKVGRDVIDVHAGVDSDHLAARLAGDVPHGSEPAIAGARVGAAQSRRLGRTGGTAPAACSSPSRSARPTGRTGWRRPRGSTRRPCPTRCARIPSGQACGACRAELPSGPKYSGGVVDRGAVRLALVDADHDVATGLSSCGPERIGDRAGTTTAWSTSMAYQASSPSQIGSESIQIGVPGMNDLGEDDESRPVSGAFSSRSRP